MTAKESNELRAKNQNRLREKKEWKTPRMEKLGVVDETNSGGITNSDGAATLSS